MPEENGAQIIYNNSYKFESVDWPQPPDDLGDAADFLFQEMGVDSPKVWNCAVHVDEADHKTWSFLTNICTIANMDIDNFHTSSQDCATRINAAPLMTYPQLLKKLANSWDLLLRLRLICDVAIMLWAKSPQNATPPHDPDRLDCIGRLLGNQNALASLTLGPGACAYLKVINQAANGIKHPIEGQNDYILPEASDELLIYREGIPHLIVQPVRDLVLGTNRFLVTVLTQIKL